MAHDISKFDDIIDSRDVITRIEELEGERDGYEIDCERCEALGESAIEDTTACSDCDDTLLVSGNETSRAAWASENSDDADELRILAALAEQGEGYGDWRHGAALIRDSYFEEYAEQLADELGYTNKEVHWPNTCIDWERAARELQSDYTSLDFDGETFWMRG